jgi:hypothetical protein
LACCPSLLLLTADTPSQDATRRALDKQISQSAYFYLNIYAHWHSKIFKLSVVSVENTENFHSGLSGDYYWVPDKCKKKMVMGSARKGKVMDRAPREDTEYSQCSPIHYHGPLKKFLESISDPGACGNLLDIGSQDLARPWFVT